MQPKFDGPYFIMQRLLRQPRHAVLPVAGDPTKACLARIPGLYRLMLISPEAVDYFAHPTFYLTDHSRADFAGSGIEPPPFLKYVDQLVDYLRSHPEVGSAAMF